VISELKRGRQTGHMNVIDGFAFVLSKLQKTTYDIYIKHVYRYIFIGIIQRKDTLLRIKEN
jgi:hypothetical protein